MQACLKYRLTSLLAHYDYVVYWIFLIFQNTYIVRYWYNIIIVHFTILRQEPVQLYIFNSYLFPIFCTTSAFIAFRSAVCSSQYIPTNNLCQYNIQTVCTMQLVILFYCLLPKSIQFKGLNKLYNNHYTNKYSFITILTQAALTYDCVWFKKIQRRVSRIKYCLLCKH